MWSVANYEQPQRKREQFAVNLRRARIDDLLTKKRRPNNHYELGSKRDDGNYRGVEGYEIQVTLDKFCPGVYNNKSINDVYFKTQPFQVAKVQHLLNALMTNKMSPTERMHIIVAIRRTLADNSDPPVDEILLETNIMHLVSMILSEDDNTPEQRIDKVNFSGLTYTARSHLDPPEPLLRHQLPCDLLRRVQDQPTPLEISRGIRLAIPGAHLQLLR